MPKTNIETSRTARPEPELGEGAEVPNEALLSEELFAALKDAAAVLHRSRQIGVRIDVPKHIRKELIRKHGDVARNVFMLVDGRLPL